jgi:hypothetical protein
MGGRLERAGLVLTPLYIHFIPISLPAVPGKSYFITIYILTDFLIFYPDFNG